MYDVADTRPQHAEEVTGVMDTSGILSPPTVFHCMVELGMNM